MNCRNCGQPTKSYGSLCEDCWVNSSVHCETSGGYWGINQGADGRLPQGSKVWVDRKNGDEFLEHQRIRE